MTTTDQTSRLAKVDRLIDDLPPPIEAWATEYVRIHLDPEQHTFNHANLDGWTRDGWEPFGVFTIDGTAYVAVRRRTRR